MTQPDTRPSTQSNTPRNTRPAPHGAVPHDAAPHDAVPQQAAPHDAADAPHPFAVPPQGHVDRAGLLQRHSPQVRSIDPRSPLQLGNGNLAFTADITGLQTFPQAYPVTDAPSGAQTADEHAQPIGSLLGTMSTWGWHCVPFDHLPGVPAGTPAPGIEVALRDYQTPRGPVPYVDLSQEQWGGDTGQPDIREEWLRNNPHRLDLGRISLWQTGGLDAQDVTDIDQRLDLASGTLTSRFCLRGMAYAVTTTVHPHRDELAIRIERYRSLNDSSHYGSHDAAGLDAQAFGIDLRFAYGSQDWGNSQDWTTPQAHSTQVTDLTDAAHAQEVGVQGAHTQGVHRYLIDRILDETRYTVGLHVVGAHAVGSLVEIEPHHLRLTAQDDVLDVVVRFSPASSNPAPSGPVRPADATVSDASTVVLDADADTTVSDAAVPDVTSARVASDAAAWWAQFWAQGAAISFDGTVLADGRPDPRAVELERRTVLSQYLTAINCAGATPSAETGLMLNSWRGKFHLEMHWWHAAHFPAWGRPQLLTPALGWYNSIMEPARATARRQGYAGARWPKQTDPSGRETPSSIGTFLIWQQPHPIYLAELTYRARPTAATLEAYEVIVRETADFMASFAQLEADGYYHLPAPLVPSQESYARQRAITADPTFELAYWAWGLEAAAGWLERMGRAVPPLWREVASAMWRPQPHVFASTGEAGTLDAHGAAGNAAGADHAAAGIYPAIPMAPYTIRDDHPSMIAALGLVPDTGLIDHDVMAATLDDITGSGIGDSSSWNWPSTWGWDYPMAALTASRLGRPQDAIDWLLFDYPTAGQARGKNEYLTNGHNYQTSALPIYLPGNGGLLAALGLMASMDQGFPASWQVAHEGFIRMP